MKNGYEVLWSDEALANFNSTIQYLYRAWTEKEVAKFVRDVNKGIRHIQFFPHAYPHTIQDVRVRRYVMSKIHTIFYRIDSLNNIILILSIFDNRSKGFVHS
jgi:plasmid stabilization system protein ParE